MDDRQRARELASRLDTTATAYGMLGEKELPTLLREAAAALRAAPEAVALRTAMTTLEQIASTPRNKGARMNAKATLLFLQTQLAARPQEASDAT